MNKAKNISLENATGKIDYTLMNDYMFRAVLQENEKALKGLICSLMHLKPNDVESVVITNPIILGKHINDRTFILDVNVMLNNAQVINLEMQVARQSFWADRSLSYLCGLFNNLGKSDNYSKIKPTCHISILNFTPFPKYPELYAANMMINVKKLYIYNDKFSLNVLDLTQIHLATEEDKAHKIDYWAKLFKASTWEDLNMLAQTENVFKEASNTVFRLNQNEEVRYICEMREEGQRILNTYIDMLDESQHTIKTYEDRLQHAIKTYEDRLQESQHAIKTYEGRLQESQEELAQSAAALAEKDSALANQQAVIDELQAELKKYKEQ